MKKKISLLLVLTMLMTLLPISLPVMAATNIQGVDTAIYGNITTESVIYFGQYTKKDNNKAPIQWRVMGVEDGKATLLSDEILEYRKFDSSAYDGWIGSDICYYLNSEFLTTAFTTAEQVYISTYSNVQEHGFEEAGAFIPNQKIVLPSVNEVRDDGAFGWKPDSDREAQNADEYRGTPNDREDQYWWLRSLGEYDFFVACVGVTGQVFDRGSDAADRRGVRPVLKLDLESVLFTSDASGTGAKTGTPNSMLNSVVTTNNEKKLTLIDQYDVSTNLVGQNVDITSVPSKYIQGQETEIEINYSNATTGTNQYLSAMITDNSGALKYYGSIKSLEADASGTAKVTVPQDFEEGWKLKIFTEQLNGDKQTDYASTPVEVALQKAIDPLPQVSKGDKLYFGQYTKNDESKAPILWRVMEKNLLKDTLTLMSEDILVYRQYDPLSHKNWSGSDICKYLNSEEPYASNGFLTTAFTESEREKYITQYSDTQESGYNTGYTFIPNQKIVLPSVHEVKSTGTFGWITKDDRVAQDADGCRGTPSSGANQSWWLRSPSMTDVLAECVYSVSEIGAGIYGAGVYYSSGVRPALKLNLSAELLTSIQSIESPSEITGVTNGISAEDLRSQLPTTVKVNNGPQVFKVEWDLNSYDITKKEAYTYTFQGKVRPEGPFVLKGGNDLSLFNTTISVTVEAATYQIEYVLNEGTQAADAPTQYTYGEGTALPTPTRAGYSFKGWYEHASLIENAITNITGTDSGNKKYWAKWEQNTQGGGSGGSSGGGGSSSGNPSQTTPATTPTSTPPVAPATPVSAEAIKKAEEAISKLPESQKQEIIKKMKEDLPYTLPEGGLTIEQLKALTKNKFTEAELLTIAKKPELLKALGIDMTTLAATIVLKPIENPAFKDVISSHWAADTIKEAAKLGIVAGREDGNFAPSAPLQVADTFTFLDRVLLRHNITASTLPRSTVEKYITDKKHWAFNHIASIGSKLSENTLQTISKSGDKPLTRELLAQTIYEITKGKLKAVKEVPAFTDTQNSAYQEAINYCVSIGLLNGTSKNTMSPQKELTRAELMTILIRLDKMLK